ncbi:MAG: hypothetical protein M1380_08605 [Chloroflexi bacterium]|nr:hypothetical protein [Chloroflexota bacterium]
MAEKIVRPERRRLERRQDRLAALGDAVEEGSRDERRIHCWDIEVECSEGRRKKCAAHFVKRNCWDLWAAEYFPPGRKPCCHGDLDCSQCPVAAAKFGGPVSVYVEVPTKERGARTRPPAVERPSTYCPFLYSLKDGAGLRSDGDGKPMFRCQRRRGIQLHGTYVSEVCGSPEHRECTFYDTE